MSQPPPAAPARTGRKGTHLAASAPPAAATAPAAPAPLQLSAIEDRNAPIRYWRRIRKTGELVAIPKPLDPATESIAGHPNYGFRSLNTMAGALIEARVNVRSVTATFSRKGGACIRFPSDPSNVYWVTIDPTVPFFPRGDGHNGALANPLFTIAIRMSTDSAMLPPISDQKTFDPRLFAIYTHAQQPGRIVKHHGLPNWIHFRYPAPATARRAWMNVHLGNVIQLGEATLAELCGLLPPDFQIDVLVHFDSNRVDCYFWSISSLAQVAVCFEPWYGGNDHFGRLGGAGVRR